MTDQTTGSTPSDDKDLNRGPIICWILKKLGYDDIYFRWRNDAIESIKKAHPGAEILDNLILNIDTIYEHSIFVKTCVGTDVYVEDRYILEPLHLLDIHTRAITLS